MPFLLVIPVLMYLGWRAWLAPRGVPYQPRGHWTSRTDAMHEYMKAHTPPRRSARQRWSIAAMMVVEYVLITWLLWSVTDIEHSVLVAMLVLLAALSIWMARWDWDR